MLFWIIITFIIILEAKVLRDVIAFRFSWSILTTLPDWMQEWLQGSRPNLNEQQSVFDGWHFADALIIAPAWILSMWFYLQSFWWALLSYVLFWIIFYQAFNWQYHWLWMLPQYRENPWKRDYE